MVFVTLDRQSSQPLSRQLYEQLQLKIARQEIPAGYRLPASRVLAKDLGVSRNLVTEVYDTLSVEGFLESRTGSGTFVAKGAALKPRRPRPPATDPPPSGSTASGAHAVEPDTTLGFDTGIPAELFPRGHWGRCLRDAALYAPDGRFGYGMNEGVLELRESLKAWLAINKGIRCDVDQVFVFPGTHAAVRTLLEVSRGDPRPWITEDPTLPSLRSMVANSGRTHIPVVVDDAGPRIGEIPPGVDPGFALVTPSHNYPLGTIMTIQRRVELIDRMERSGGYVIENDYDGELIYKGPTLSSMFLLAPERVIHVGSFSGSLYPGLRMAYMVAPRPLIERIAETKASSGAVCPTLDQVALARFIDEGYYDNHVLRLKRHFSKLHSAFAAALESAFGERVSVLGIGAGQYLAARFTGADVLSARDEISRAGVRMSFAEGCTDRLDQYRDLGVFSFGTNTREEILEGVDILSRALRRG